jgi:hypothetical protein
MRAIIGHSDDVDVDDAISELLEQCERDLAGEQPKGGVLYSTNEYDSERVLAAIAQRWPGLPLVGASTAGEMSSRLGFREDSICLTLFAGDDVAVRASNGPNAVHDLEGALDGVVAGLGAGKPALCILIAPATVNVSDVLRGVHARMGERSCPIVGGLSGDHTLSLDTWQFFGANTLQDSISVLALYGDFSVGVGVASGWFPIGRRHTVTRSDGAAVYEIDGKPAIEMYQGLWNDRVTGNLGEFPLAVFDHEDPTKFFLRAAMVIDSEAGCVRFAGDVPQGASVCLTEVVPEGLLSGTRASLQEALGNFHGAHADVALLFSCAARKWVLGTRAKEEMDQFLASIEELAQAKLPLAGFYAFGEISPLAGSGAPVLHNETCVTVLVGK